MSYSAVSVAALRLARGAVVTLPILTHDTRSGLAERPEKRSLHHSQHGTHSHQAAIDLTAGRDRARGAAGSAGHRTPPPTPRRGARSRPRAGRHRPGP